MRMRSPLRNAARMVRNVAPVPYVAPGAVRASRWFGGGPDQSTEAQLGATAGNGTLFAIVNRLSTAVAKATWRLYRDPGGRAPADTPRQEVTRHLALDVLNKPNDHFTGRQIVEVSQQHLDLTGEGCWVTATTPGFDAPLELWPVRPDRIVPVKDPVKFLIGYVYCAPGGEEVPLAVEQVLRPMMPNPLDLYRGLGPVQSILVDLDATRYSAEWNRRFFLNDATPGGIIKLTRTMDETEFKKWRNRWQQQHQGVQNAHRVALLEEGEWIDVKYTQRDMQFTQLRDVSRELIREAFGMSKTMLGQSEDVNRASAQAAEYVFAQWVVTERLDRWKDILNFRYLPLFGAAGAGLSFDYDPPAGDDPEQVNADRDSRVSAAVALRGAGWDPDDCLESQGLPPMRWVGTGAAEPVSGEDDDAEDPVSATP